MLAFLRELFILAREEGLTLYRYRRAHPDKFLTELKGRRLLVRGKRRQQWLDGRIDRWTARAEEHAHER